MAPINIPILPESGNNELPEADEKIKDTRGTFVGFGIRALFWCVIVLVLFSGGLLKSDNIKLQQKIDQQDHRIDSLTGLLFYMAVKQQQAAEKVKKIESDSTTKTK